MPVPPTAPPPAHLRQEALPAQVLTPPGSDDDHDDGAHHGVAELQTDGVGENADGQIKEPCGVRFKNLTLMLQKSVSKLFLQEVLGISDDGI